MKRVLGFVATSVGWVVLAIAAIELTLLFYFRPTLESTHVGEYAYVGGQARQAPLWLTGEFIGSVFGVLLGIIGGMLLWVGRRWRLR